MKHAQRMRILRHKRITLVTVLELVRIDLIGQIKHTPTNLAKIT